MRLEYYARIELRGADTSIADATLYVSTHGGYRIAETGAVQYWPPVLRIDSSYTAKFARVDDPYQIPQTMTLSIDNSAGLFDDYLPGGAQAQIWELSAVTIWRGGTTADGGTLTTADREFSGVVARGTLTYGVEPKTIGIDVYDIRADQNKPVLQQTWADHPLYDAANNNVDPSATMPVVLGDWTAGTERLPCYRVAANRWAVCGHEIGTGGATYLDVEKNGAPVSGVATTYASDGAFALSATDSDTVTVKCVGKPSVLTDYNHVRLIEHVLTDYAGADAATEINNQIADPSTGQRGSFRALYDATGGASSPEYEPRAYISDASLRAVDLAAAIAYECGCRLTVVGGRYNIYWEVAASSASDIVALRAWEPQGGESIEISSDPNDEQVTRYVIRYGYDPATGLFGGKYDSVSDNASPRYAALRAEWLAGGHSDLERTDEYLYLHKSSQVTAAGNIRSGWRVRAPQYLTVRLLASSQDAGAYAVDLFGDFTLPIDRLQGVTFRAVEVRRSYDRPAVELVALGLSTVPAQGIWTDSAGTDGAGNMTLSKWGDAAGTDGAGNYVGNWT